MKLCLFGNKGTTTVLAQHLLDRGFAIDTLVTLGQSARAKVDIAGADDSLAQMAKTAGITVYEAEKYSLATDRDQRFFAEHPFDIGLCTGWQRLIPDSILGQFKLGVFGWHGSGFRFPNGRGRSPLNWSIRLGLDQIYHNCFRYAAGVDDGGVFETEVLPIAPSDHIADLQAKAVTHIKSSAVRVLEAAQRDQLVVTDQVDHPFITFPALTEAAGFLAPARMHSQDAINITRSCSRPFPGAFVTRQDTGEKIRIWRCAETTATGYPSELKVGQAFCHDGRLFVRMTDAVLVSDDFEMGETSAALPFDCC